jgi:glycosyltransferase involved in cell wall biosynthesis
MKIALVAPPLLKTPPTGYGGLERVLYDLGCALASKGEDVTLIAPKGSHIDGGKVIETITAPERTDVDWLCCEGDAYNIYAKELNKFDIIHDHSWFGFPYIAKFGNQNLKICHTHHGHLNWDPTKIPEQIKPINLIGISKYMQNEYREQGWSAKYVYNGINLNKYPLYNGDREGLVFVGRISKLKNPHLAIRAAIETRQHIDVIGGSFVDDKNYLNDVKKMCEDSGGRATLHLDLPHEEKVRLVQKAKACLVLSEFREPYGLVAAESMAMGTPVIAYNDGALREVVGEDGFAGYVCNTYEEAVKRIRDFPDGFGETLSPIKCRKRAMMFRRDIMAENYLKLYKEVIDGKNW